jgi:hypothetical protein
MSMQGDSIGIRGPVHTHINTHIKSHANAFADKANNENSSFLQKENHIRVLIEFMNHYKSIENIFLKSKTRNYHLK